MRRLGMSVVVAAVFCTSDVAALDPAPVLVWLAGSGKVRVQIADGVVTPCDSGDNHMIYDGWVKPGESIKTAVGSECACVRHTSVKFPSTDWSTSTKYCRPRTCAWRGRYCRPADDPTIRVQLTAF